ncbi:MAG TPA: ribonuclease HII, partial [Bacteroidetes bacterium]|nr:ribonuclease HII [Bacteroidota bacterium]
PKTKPNRKEENKLKRFGYKNIAGVDEAGRGSWAGPIVAAAVILPAKFNLSGINDSKKLTPKKREELYEKIIGKVVDYNVYILSNKEIDKECVGKANIKVLKKAVTGLKKKVDYALIDSFKIKIPHIKSTSIVKGDTKVLSIAAASIIAKVTRDRLMVKYDKKYPKYGFASHKGYGTKKHHQNLYRYGVSLIHRRSYQPIKELLK